MADSSGGTSSFSTQANALLRKNVTFQKRNVKENIRLISFPVLLCLIMFALQRVIDHEMNKPEKRCGCKCVDTNSDGSCENVCGIKYSTVDQVFTCAIPIPPKWPPLMQVPRPQHRAVRGSQGDSMGLPDESCRKNQSCPSTILITGGNRTFAESVAENFFPKSLSLSNVKPASLLSSLSNLALGTDTPTKIVHLIEPAFMSGRPVYTIQNNCNSTSKAAIRFPMLDTDHEIEQQCVRGFSLWVDSSSAINDQLFKGYRQSNREGSLNEVMAAYDFSNTDLNKFDATIWYNSTYKNASLWGRPPALMRVGRSVNLISNAYLRFKRGNNVRMQFEFTKEMPKPANDLNLDISSFLGGLFFTWIIGLLLPVLLTHLVYEKQHKLRTMMKMHGLGDGPYWLISYGYFFMISFAYVLLLVVFGSIIGLKFFKLNDYSIQFVFFFAYINLQIALAFFMATFYSNIKTAQAFVYIYIFGSALVAEYLFKFFLEDPSFSRHWIKLLEIIPAFSLYRGLYEFGWFSFNGGYMGTHGMRWSDVKAAGSGMKEVLIIIVVEWCVLLPLAYYLDQMASLGTRIRRNPFLLSQNIQKKIPPSFRRESFQRDGSRVHVELDKPDIIQEREKVENLLLEGITNQTIVSDVLRKVYPGSDGNPPKLAVEGLSLAVTQGECFGVLGPNGAGKTSFINMMIGLLSPTSGNGYVNGYSIETDMNKIYTSMGVCPQHDMLWETLTGREHLLFYGRLKNLKGNALFQAVEESLRTVNLFLGGVGDKKVGKYSGGMKRRLSVAISLIGDPKVVYMDEPSTGLDPTSRKNLWNVIKNAKQNRAVFLTTHSMEEAEVLCDRLGIFVGGRMQCIGNPKQLKARYGGTYVFTLTTSQGEEREVEDLVLRLSPNANKIYHISGTQKFEIPKQDVKIADVFNAVENAKRRFTIQAWGLADTTLEDVFIKVAKGSESSVVL